jgi:hypothetical protein
MELQTYPATTHRKIMNKKAALSVDLYGGAIVDFRLHSQRVNPLSFKFSREQMPQNNKNGAPYQGHFVCLGRWGEPSQGEIKAGVPNHGHLANIFWEAQHVDGYRTMRMRATSPIEGLRVHRTIEMDAEHPVVAVEEVITNVQPLGRLFNIVQHPTLAHPFLDDTMIIDCNAAIGFNQAYSTMPLQYISEWPFGCHPAFPPIDLRLSVRGHDCLHSFIVDKCSPLGWITAYSPTNKTVLGYIWKRSDYPWIHLWQDWDEEGIRYRALEFGTAGYHKPFNEIMRRPLQLFGVNTCAYIDAGEIVTRRFISFVIEVNEDLMGVESVGFERGVIKITGRNRSDVFFQSGFIDFLDK